MAHSSSSSSITTTTSFVFATIITTTVLSVYYSPSSSILVGAQTTPQVPCVFFFGDSLSDNGNNNVLPTFANVNYKPYGIDFIPQGPTGRFTNGRNTPDYLAELLGFSSPIPPFASTPLTDPNIVRGVNYASGASGILDTTGIFLGLLLSMDRQLLLHKLVKTQIETLKGSEYLKTCLYVVNIGSNDYLFNYLVPASPTRLLFPDPDQYAQHLVQKISTQLTTLYNYGARKVAVYGIGLIGCTPAQRAANNAINGCVDSVNNQVQLYNNRLKPLIDTLNIQLSGARYTFINTANINSGVQSIPGLTNFGDPCCQVSFTGLCVPYSTPCPNRNAFAFWDKYHPTSVVNQQIATRSYTAAQPADASPYDISHLVQL